MIAVHAENVPTGPVYQEAKTRLQVPLCFLDVQNSTGWLTN